MFFFFNDTATTEIYTLSLHDALPILWHAKPFRASVENDPAFEIREFTEVEHAEASTLQIGFHGRLIIDRKSTRLNSSHQIISYAVFCLKKKKTSNATV